MATKKDTKEDVLDSGTGNELSAITVKSLTNLEEKVDRLETMGNIQHSKDLCRGQSNTNRCSVSTSCTTTGICSRHCK